MEDNREEDPPLSAAPQLSGRAVHVHAVHLQAPDAVVDRFRSFLSPDEVDRAGRFRFHHLQRSFVLSRGALRTLLGHYLTIQPPDVRFRYGPKGKPSLKTPARLQFNASHSSDLALFAFTLDCEVGIDVEAIRPMTDLDDVARRFFSAEETAELVSLPPEIREQCFYFCWTRKEAYIKATGEGLSAPLDAFQVTLRREPARIVHLAHDANSARAWTLHNLEIEPGYAGALAYRDAERPLQTFPAAAPKHLLANM